MEFQTAYKLIVPLVERKDVRSLVKRGGEALSPLHILAFTPHKFASRWSF